MASELWVVACRHVGLALAVRVVGVATVAAVAAVVVPVEMEGGVGEECVGEVAVVAGVVAVGIEVLKLFLCDTVLANFVTQVIDPLVSSIISMG